MARALSSHLFGAVERLYSAAVDPAEWQSFLAEAAAVFAADNAYVSRIEHETRVLDYIVLKQLNWNAVSVERYAALMNEDPRMPAFRNNPYRPMHCRMAVPKSRLHASRAYREALKPLGIEYTLLVGLPENTTTNRFLGFTRNPSGEPFNAADLELLGELVPHLRRAFSICQQLESRTQSRDMSTQILEGLSYGVLVVNSGGMVRWMNSAARELLSRVRSLRLCHGRFELDSVNDQKKLMAVLLSALGKEDNGSSNRSAQMRLADCSDDASLSLMINAVPSGGAVRLGDGGDEELAIITIVPPRPAQEPDIEVTRRALGLSPTQARIATLLASGHSLKEVAATIGVTEGTARQYLKIIFSKTGVRRQSDLVRLMADIPAMSVARLS